MNYKYQIGQWVKVKSRIKNFEYDINNNRVLVKEECCRVGQICGAAKRKMGKLNTGRYASYAKEYEEQSYLDVKSTMTVWLVRTGMLNRPLEVLEEDMEEVKWSGMYFLVKDFPWLDAFHSEEEKKLVVL